MAACQLVFDEGLLAAEPVEGGVDLPRGDTAKAEGFAQRMAGGVDVEHPRGCQLGRRVEQPGDDERQRQVTTALRGSAGQQVGEADASGGGEGGKNVTMRQRAADFEAMLADRDERVAAQSGTQGVDALDRQLREVGKGAVLDLAILAVGFAQQERGAGVTVRDLGDVHEAWNQTDSADFKENFVSCLTT